MKERIQKLINSLMQYNQENLKSFEEFVKSYSDDLDSYVFDICKNNNLNYLTGELIVLILENNKFKMIGDLYFRDEGNNIFNYKKESNILEMENYLTNESISDINQRDYIRFTFKHSK